VKQRGLENRYDADGGGNHVDAEKRRSANGGGLFISYQKRFCEHCQQLKPKPKTRLVKGWKCADCKLNK
jgi:hypothetical protein